METNQGHQMVRKTIAYLLVGLLTFCLMYFVSTRTKLLSGLERKLLDGLFYLREPAFDEINPFVSERVQLLGFDEDSIALIGKWPWKRYVHARFLRKLQRFSPETVLFDVIFAKPESLPQFISDKLDLDPESRDRLQKAFEEMDNEFAEALSEYDNVYLDLQLIENPRETLPEDFQKRIQVNEEILLKGALPADSVLSPVAFRSLEPVLESYIKNSNPAVINVLRDTDGVIRFFPCYFTYHARDGRSGNLLSVVMSLAREFYHVDKKDIHLGPQGILFKSAKVPMLNKYTHQPKTYLKDFHKISRMIKNPGFPESYRYNRNLYNLMVNQGLKGLSGSQRTPDFPLHILENRDGTLEILDNWEVFDAAKRINSGKIAAIVYKKQDLEIKTPLGSFFYINYAGKESKYFRDPNIGKMRFHRPIPTGSYKDVYLLDDIPDIPELDEKGDIKASYDISLLEEWFYDLCEKKAEEIYLQAQKDLGRGIEDDIRLQEYMRKYPHKGRYFFYYYFLLNNKTGPGMLRDLFGIYPQFGRQIGQSPDNFLSENQVLNSLMDQYAEQFDKYHNKFIFAGTIATGIGDVQQTPYANMFGINVIINAFNTIITGNSLKMSWDIKYLDFMLLLAVSILCSLIYGSTNIRLSSFIFILLFFGIFISSFIVFNTYSLYLKTTPLVISNVVIFVSMVMFKLLTEEKDKKFLKATFKNYLSPELIEDMHSSKTMPKLGGEAKTITAFFTDIQGFSTFSEKLTAEQLVELLNEYLSAMTDILIDEKGTLDKYEGDAIVAFFGAPMDLPDHALRACRVALGMQQKLLELREKWGAEKQEEDQDERNASHLPPEQWRPGDKWPVCVHEMRMRIGINTGGIVVGNMGSAMRMNYTMMGDSVNLAARLEAAGKQYGVYILVSQYTLEQEFRDVEGKKRRIMDAVETRLIDNITVVGRSMPVKVYEICAMKGELSDKERELFRLFDEGLSYYLAMEWEKAMGKFKEANGVERFPDAGINPSRVYIERCELFQDTPPVPPGEIWDGVFRLTMK